jgi:hypothetical protein
MVFTVDRNGNPGHPTRRFDQIRKLLKRGQVRIIGGGVSSKPVTAVFVCKSFDADKTVTRQFTRVIMVISALQSARSRATRLWFCAEGPLQRGFPRSRASWTKSAYIAEPGGLLQGSRWRVSPCNSSGF